MAVSFGNSDTSLTTTAQAVVLAGASSSLTITRISATNTDTVAHTITIYRLFNGVPPSVSNQIVSPGNWPGTIAAGETIAIPLTGHNLLGNQALYAQANVNNLVNLSISYVQQDN